MKNPVYIVDALRTPVGKAPKGIFSKTRPDDLLSFILKGLVDKTGIPPQTIEDVIIGCAMPEGEQGMNVARISSLLAGLPVQVPGMTINRFCSSGLQAISLAADRIACGEADVIIAGGVESMSYVPMGGHHYSANLRYFQDEQIAIAYGMGITAEIVATRWGISREKQEVFALESHRRALAAQAEGHFKAEIFPITITQDAPNLMTASIDSRSTTFSQDEGPRADSSLQKMESLPSVFAYKGSVTAATSSQMSDGAGAVLLVSERILKHYALKPMAKFLAYACVGLPPEVMGVGPIEAVKAVLKKTNLSLSDLDWIELNEAFAAQSLAVIESLDLDPQKVNPLGGAIALGHPLGATGAIRTATCLHGLARLQKKYGMVTMCIGTGMGAAGIFESLCN